MVRKKTVPTKCSLNRSMKTEADKENFENRTTVRRSQRLEPKKTVEPKKENLRAKSTKRVTVAESSSVHKCRNPKCKNLKPFSSLSSLNQHIRIKHKGVRWICPYCQEEQSSKYSQDRHIQRRHTKNHKEDLDQNQFELGHRVKMTEKAKDSFLHLLVIKVERQDKIIVELKNKLKEALIKLAQLEGNSCDESNVNVSMEEEERKRPTMVENYEIDDSQPMDIEHVYVEEELQTDEVEDNKTLTPSSNGSDDSDDDIRVGPVAQRINEIQKSAAAWAKIKQERF